MYDYGSSENMKKYNQVRITVNIVVSVCGIIRYSAIFSDITYPQLHIGGRTHLKESTEKTMLVPRTETLEEFEKPIRISSTNYKRFMCRIGHVECFNMSEQTNKTNR